MRRIAPEGKELLSRVAKQSGVTPDMSASLPLVIVALTASQTPSRKSLSVRANLLATFEIGLNALVPRGGDGGHASPEYRPKRSFQIYRPDHDSGPTGRITSGAFQTSA